MGTSIGEENHGVREIGRASRRGDWEEEGIGGEWLGPGRGAPPLLQPRSGKGRPQFLMYKYNQRLCFENLKNK